MVGYGWDTKNKPSLIAGKWSIPKFVHFISNAFFPYNTIDEQMIRSCTSLYSSEFSKVLKYTLITI